MFEDEMNRWTQQRKLLAAAQRQIDNASPPDDYPLTDEEIEEMKAAYEAEQERKLDLYLRQREA